MLQRRRRLLSGWPHPLHPLRNADMTFFLSLLFACTGPPGATGHADLPALPAPLTAVSSTAGEVRPFREAILALTGAVQGEIEPCGCPTTPFGGFERRDRLLSRAEKMGPPVFVFDAGAMLLKGATALAEGDRRLRAETVLSLAESTGLDVWAPAPTDLVPGGVALLEHSHALSATWLAPDGTQAFPPASIVEHGGVRIGVVGVSAPVDGLGARDPIEAVVGAMQGEADLWVVLSNADPVTNRSIAALDGVGLILTTPGEIQEEPDTSHGAPIIEAAPRGRFVTFVHVSLGTSPRAVELTIESPWRELANTRERGEPKEPSAVELWVAAMKRTQSLVATASAGHNFGYVTSIPLASDLDDSVGSTPISAQLEAFRKATLAQAKAAAAASTERSFAGVGNCGTCHADRIVQWFYDPHANAMDALSAADKARDPECVGCHTTGFAQPGGFSGVEPADIEPFKGVQCEACHGPMAGHSRAGDVAHQTISERTCRTCHDPANSPQFNYTKYLARISCTRVSGGSDADPAAVTPIPTLRGPH